MHITISKTIRWMVIIAMLLLAIPTLSAGKSYAQGTSRTFPETGKTVQGQFLTYWETNGGLAQQGYPISDELQEVSDTDGKTYTMQYFERAVFELHPELNTANQVLLSLLGTFLYNQKYPTGAPGQTPNSSVDTLYYPQTGHSLGGRFKAYWDIHGGLAQQGYPISDEFSELSPLDGKIYTVQYFQRAVFEYHPELAGTQYEVLLSQLGKFRYDQKYPSGGPPSTRTITIDGPPPNSFVLSPFAVAGRTNYYPFEGNLNYAVTDDLGTQLGTGFITVTGNPGSPSTFSAPIAFTPPNSGANINLRIYEIDQSSGAVVAATTVRYQVVVGPVVTPTIPPLPPETRTITISSPNPGSQVTSSPVVVTGSTNYYPFEGNLTYQVVNNTGQQIGTGAISVQGAMGGPTTFSAPVAFTMPPAPNVITIEVYNRDQSSGNIVASASFSLRIVSSSSTRSITIDTPEPGSVVRSSPVVVTGSTNYYPFEGNLTYQVVNNTGQQIGTGAISVQGAMGGPTTFSAPVVFNLPATPGTVTVRVYERDQGTGEIVASASLTIQALP